MATGVEIVTETKLTLSITKTQRNKKRNRRITGVKHNFTIVSGDEFMKKGKYFGSKKPLTFTRSNQPTIDGYLSGMCAGKTKQILKKVIITNLIFP